MVQNGAYEVFAQLEKDYSRLTEEGYDLFGVFLYGSQNYGLDHKESDIDVFAIYYSSPRIDAEQTTYFRPEENGNIHPISMKTFYQGLDLQEKKTLEIIFTPFFYVNPKYNKLYQKLKEKRNEIARAQPRKTLERLLQYSQNELKNAKKYQTNSMKRVANVRRVLYLAEKYAMNQPYEKCLVPTQTEREELLAIKTVYQWTFEEQVRDLERSVALLEKINQAWEAPPDNAQVLKEVQGYFDERII